MVARGTHPLMPRHVLHANGTFPILFDHASLYLGAGHGRYYHRKGDAEEVYLLLVIHQPAAEGVLLSDVCATRVVTVTPRRII